MSSLQELTDRIGVMYTENDKVIRTTFSRFTPSEMTSQNRTILAEAHTRMQVGNASGNGPYRIGTEIKLTSQVDARWAETPSEDFFSLCQIVRNTAARTRF